MVERRVRSHARVLGYLEAALFAVATLGALRLVPFYPTWLMGVIALCIGAVAVTSAPVAAILFVLAFSIPVIAADLVIGVLALIAGLIGSQYLADGRALGFLLAVLIALLVPFHAAWALVAFSGYALGRGKGAVTAAAACVVVIATGIVIGAPAIGSLATGGSAPGLIALGGAAIGDLTLSWVPTALRSADPAAAASTFGSAASPLHLGAEALLWALAAVLGGVFRMPRARARALGGVAAAVTALAAGHVALDFVFAGPVSLATFALDLGVSLAVALALATIAEWVFPVSAVAASVSASPGAQPDVDDLLRTIATAEDQLASRHQTECVVMITDMKSFSAMTEQVGSVESAKIVQRHRDLLLPIIAREGGHGTATGGDGLVAAFETPANALRAATAMQRALDGYTGSKRDPHELAVRIGIASGEVVVDAHGCPFLGEALNLAARVMDLADGGRIMATGAVASRSGMSPAQFHAHGEYKLKNIAEAVPVVEVLWRDEQTPQEVRAT